MTKRTYTAILEKEGDGFIALCPEFDVASQGATVEEATANLKEAVELFLECADPQEIERLTLPPQVADRLMNFKATLLDEVHEIDEIIAFAKHGGPAIDIAVGTSASRCPKCRSAASRIPATDRRAGVRRSKRI